MEERDKGIERVIELNYRKIKSFDEIDRLMTEAYEYYNNHPDNNEKRQLVKLRFAENVAQLFLKLKEEDKEVE